METITNMDTMTYLVLFVFFYTSFFRLYVFLEKKFWYLPTTLFALTYVLAFTFFYYF